MQSGGLNPSSSEAFNHAERYYKSVRSCTTDCEKISKNTGKSVEIISLIKGYIFLMQHSLYEGFKTFYPSYEMAESWRRLSGDKRHIQPHDLLLLEHELLEIKYIISGLPQHEAHDKANSIYNYTNACSLFYLHQKFRK